MRTRYLLLLSLLCPLLCPGCAIPQLSIDYYAPSLNFELVESPGWELLTPPHEWVFSPKRALPSQYFGDKVGSYGSVYNYFYATYKIAADSELAIFIYYPFSFANEKTIYGENIYYDITGASVNKIKGTIIAVNKINVSFDNASVYFLQKNRNINGREVKYKTIYWIKPELLPHAVYDLSSDNVIKEKQQETTGKPWGFSSFSFIFEDMTYLDYEDATFVIDGFYHEGKKLPPLKVHMNYFDFEALPRVL